MSLSARTHGREVVVDAATPGSLRRATWTIGADADAVQLDYEYAFDGDVDLARGGFALPATGITSKRWLGRGPYRVYRNRLEGTVFDLHQVAYNDPVPGQSFTYPEFKGYFRDWQWLQLDDDARHASRSRIARTSRSSASTARATASRPCWRSRTPDWRCSTSIPAIGNKFDTPDQLGPQSRTPKVSGIQRGSVVLRFAGK